MTALRIHGAKPLRGRTRVPVDLDVAQCVLLMAALADGVSELPTLPAGSDAEQFLKVLGSFGVETRSGAQLEIDGVGLRGLRMPRGALDCGSAWLGMALGAGLLCGQQFGTRITVHASLAARSVETLVGALRARGGHIAGRTDSNGRLVPPLSVAPLASGERLHALDCSFESADAAAKSGVLTSALFAAGPTTIAERLVSADHLERAFVGLGLPLRRIGSVISFDPAGWDGSVPAQRSRELPGSATVAASLCVAAQLVAGSAIELEAAGINPSRSGVLDVLRSWGGDVAIAPSGDASLREPIGEIRLRPRGLRGGVLGAEELVRARSELTLLALLGASSRRGVQLFDLQAIEPAREPRWRELQALWRAFGMASELAEDSLRIAPDVTFTPANVDLRDDAELALAAVTLALASPGTSVLEHAAEALARTYPGFIEAAQHLGADIQTA